MTKRNKIDIVIFVWVILFMLFLSLTKSHAQTVQELPDAPSQVKTTQPTPFFKTRHFYDPPLRTNREILTSKTFLILHGVELSSVIFDAEMTHQGLAHHKCVEGNFDLSTHPSRGDLYKYNLLTFAGLTSLDFVFDKYVWRPLSLVSPVYNSAVHFRAGASWGTECF